MKAAMKLALGLAACWAGAAVAASAAAASGALEKEFVSPPESARPWVYWFWLNGNITPEGITADLEAMKRVGIGGVLIMEVDQGRRRAAWRSPVRGGASCFAAFAARPPDWDWR